MDDFGKVGSHLQEIVDSIPKAAMAPMDAESFARLQKDGWRAIDTGELVPAEMFDKALGMMGEGNYRILELRAGVAEDGIYKSAQIMISPVGIENLGLEMATMQAMQKAVTIH